MPDQPQPEREGRCVQQRPQRPQHADGLPETGQRAHTGRGDRAGEVIVQTFTPQSSAIQYFSNP